jgi:surface carbohydrate biosynthesis protein
MNIKNKLIKLLKAKWVFTNPEKKDLLIYDSDTGKIFLKYIDIQTFQFLDTRGETIYVYILFKSLLSIIFFNKNFSEVYFVNFIKASKPKFILTHNDIDVTFWKLKKFFPNIIFIVVQNSNRASGYDENAFYGIKKNRKNSHNVDYLFLLGDSFKRYYLKYFKVKNIVCVGSLKNNLIVNKIPKPKKNIVFISQFLPNQNLTFTQKNGNKIERFESFLKCDEIVLKFLIKYCNKKNYKLKILLKKKTKDEEIYFNKILKNKQYAFIKQKKNQHNYELLNRHNFFVTIDSTLGYEALSRNRRVACFSIRNTVSKLFLGESFNYGVLGGFNQDGMFWTNKLDEKKMYKIMEFITRANSSTWQKVKKKFVDPLILYDYEQVILLKKLNNIGITLNRKVKKNLIKN